MLSYKVNLFVKGQKMSSIGNLTDALAHYRSKAGGRVPANESLINEMKNDSTFKSNFGSNGSVVKGIQSKIQEALRNGNSIVENAPGSRRGMNCDTLGSYSASIEYKHHVTPGKNSVKIRLFGSDCWDFEPSDAHSWFGNLTKEIIPGMLAGDGKPFDITYDFTITVEINA